MYVPRILKTGFGAIVALCFVLALHLAGAAAAADLKPRADALIANVDGSAGVWIGQSDGSVRHVQSGLVCPPTFSQVKLGDLFVFPTNLGEGGDVGCDYRRGEINALDAKLSVFATRHVTGDSLKTLYEHYDRAVKEHYPDAQRTDRVSTARDSSKSPALPETEQASYEFTVEGVALKSLLIISLVGEWEVVVRLSYLAGKPGALYLDDATSAWYQAVSTVAPPTR